MSGDSKSMLDRAAGAQNPDKVTHGTYKDAAVTLPEADKFPNLKEGPQPSPFKGLSQP